MKRFLKGYVEKAEDNGILSVAIATDDSVDRDGERIDPKGWDFSNFQKNPVLLWAHSYRDEPIGKVLNIRREGNKVLFQPQFAIELSEKARQIFEMFKQGFLSTFSVGFIPKEWQDEQDDAGKNVRTFTKAELLEISAVPVPSNPNATVQVRGMKGVDESLKEQVENGEDFENKSIVPYSDHGIVENLDAEWNGPGEVIAAGEDLDKLKGMSTWFEQESASDKSSYKLPHHRASDLKAVWRGVSAAMAALLGARGGVKIPEADRRGVYNHLAKHYKQFDKTPPEFKLVEAQVLKDLDLETDAVIVINVIQGDAKQIETIKQDVENIKSGLAENGNKEPDAKEKVGELLKSPEFTRGVLKAVDKALGTSLRDLNRNKPN